MIGRRFGLTLFLFGAVITFIGAWVAPWFTSPVWRSAPPEAFEGTAWAAFGPIFMAMSFVTPAGILLLAIGTVIIGDAVASHARAYSIGMVLVIASFLFPPTLEYYPNLFGVAGLIITVFFFLALWFWAKNHRLLTGPLRAASIYQLLSYVLVFLVALLLCTLLGNPFSGLYFPERVLAQNALPFHYSFGMKAAAYLALAMFFTFLSQRARARAGD